jgi:hypothetical protein
MEGILKALQNTWGVFGDMEGLRMVLQKHMEGLQSVLQPRGGFSEDVTEHKEVLCRVT